MSELDENLKMMKTGKACDPDRLTAEMLNHLGGKWSIRTTSVDESWSSSRGREIPGMWKKGIIVPIAKAVKPPSELKLQANIIGIACGEANLERIAKERLYAWLERSHHLPEEQAAFRHGRSTEDSIAHIYSAFKTAGRNRQLE